jgi:hypothetical protein
LTIRNQKYSRKNGQHLLKQLGFLRISTPQEPNWSCIPRKAQKIKMLFAPSMEYVSFLFLFFLDKQNLTDKNTSGG